MTHCLILFAALFAAQTAIAAEINGCPIRSATLCVEWDLRGADLHGAELTRAGLRQSNLSGADLQGANLFNANMDMVDLTSANLSGAILDEADLKNATMTDAKLNLARLVDANLKSADLTNADLTGAKLKGATRIIAVDGIAERLSMAKRMGADITIDFRKTEPVAEIMRRTEGRGGSSSQRARASSDSAIGTSPKAIRSCTRSTTSWCGVRSLRRSKT